MVSAAHLLCLLVVTLSNVAESNPLDASEHASVSILTHAQEANESRYPNGRLKFTLKVGQTHAKERINNTYSLFRGTVQWNLNNVRTEIERWGPNAPEDRPEDEQAERELVILNPTRYVFYDHGPRLFIYPLAGATIKVEYNLIPRQYWYSSQLAPNYPAIKAFDRSKSTTTLNQWGTISVTKDSDSEIRLVRSVAETGDSVDATFSYKYDGNLLQCNIYEPKHYGKKPKYSVVNVWRKDRLGRTVLMKSERVLRALVGSREQSVNETLEVTDFDPDFKPPAEAFTLEAIRFSQRVTIIDAVANKTYRSGDRATSAVFVSFDRLVELMRSRGFASQQR